MKNTLGIILALNLISFATMAATDSCQTQPVTTFNAILKTHGVQVSEIASNDFSFLGMTQGLAGLMQDVQSLSSLSQASSQQELAASDKVLQHEIAGMSLYLKTTGQALPAIKNAKGGAAYGGFVRLMDKILTVFEPPFSIADRGLRGKATNDDLLKSIASVEAQQAEINSETAAVMAALKALDIDELTAVSGEFAKAAQVARCKIVRSEYQH